MLEMLSSYFFYHQAIAAVISTAAGPPGKKLPAGFSREGDQLKATQLRRRSHRDDTKHKRRRKRSQTSLHQCPPPSPPKAKCSTPPPDQRRQRRPTSERRRGVAGGHTGDRRGEVEKEGHHAIRMLATSLAVSLAKGNWKTPPNIPEILLVFLRSLAIACVACLRPLAGRFLPPPVGEGDRRRRRQATAAAWAAGQQLPNLAVTWINIRPSLPASSGLF